MSSGESTFTRAKISVGNAVFEFEGTEEFVTARLREYESKIVRLASELSEGDEETTDAATDKKVVKKRPLKRKSRSKASSSNTDATSGVNPDNPTLDKNLDMSGIEKFYARYRPRNHPEKILIFMRFLVDEVGIQTPNTDQIYTCYNAIGEKPAAAFVQSFRDTSGQKYGYINYDSANSISLTFIGNRHFDHDLKKATDE